MPTGPYSVIDPTHPDPYNPTSANSGFLPFCTANRWAFKQGNDWYACIYDYFGHTPPWDVVRFPALDILKSTDGGASWSLCDSGNNPWVPDSGPGIGSDERMSVLAARSGSKIYGISSTPTDLGPPVDYSKRKVLISEFDMATASWSSGFTDGSFEIAPTLGWPSWSASIPILYTCSRSNGDVILFHNGPKDGSGFDRIHYAVWNGSSWGTQTLCVSVANRYCYPCGAIEDENGIIHLIYAQSTKDNFTGFVTDLAFYHLGIAADYSLGTPQVIQTGLQSYYRGWATSLCSYPVLHGGNIHLAFTAAYGGSSIFNDIYYAVASAALNPTFTVDGPIQGSGGAWPYPYRANDLAAGAAVAVLVGDDRDLWFSASYHGSTPGVEWRERTHYYRDSSSNPKILWVEDWPTYPGLPAPPAGKMRVAYSEKDPVTGWSDPADYLYIDQETEETITAIVCTVEAAVVPTQSWGYFGRPSSGYGGGFGQGWGFFG